jgi:hypothetical protein
MEDREEYLLKDERSKVKGQRSKKEKKKKKRRFQEETLGTICAPLLL